ncbi:MAG TPA: hypothetical protein VI933_05050 [archaeon]|nr:hypothetical protein [archaeon]
MKTYAIFLAALVFISACVNISDTSNAQISGKVEKSSEDILIRAEVAQPVLKAGQPTNIRFTAENKQPFTLKNFKLNAYDLCGFTCEPADVSWDEAEIRTNQTKIKTFTCRAPQTEFEKSCQLQFRAIYDADLFQTHGIVVLSEGEFATGKTHSVPKSTSSGSPLKISASWSETLPFVEKDDVYLTLDYSYTGDGIIDKLRGNEGNGNIFGDVNITFPSDLELDEKNIGTNCADFSKIIKSAGSANLLNLKRTLTFIDKKAKPSTCQFKTKVSGPVETGTLEIDARFTYQIDGSVGVVVKPK